MKDYKSKLAGGKHGSADLADEAQAVLTRFPLKFYWFASKGYIPHVWQMMFHGSSQDDGLLTMNRHLVAGRRGGKTLSAAWEVLFYALHPEQFHHDAKGESSDRPLWMWVLTKDYPTGFASQHTLLEVMHQAGLINGKDFKFNKTERRIDFENGTLLQFKTADDPQSLRGAGLDVLWMDEAAFITNDEAYQVVSPALAEKQGHTITTTTPHGKNWLYDTFFTGKALTDPRESRVQYTSIENPYFPAEQWKRYRERMHPVMFKQEFMASFEAMHGVALQGDWLKFWTAGKVQKPDDYSIAHLFDDTTGRFDLEVYLGVDPAVALSDSADQFAMAAVGVTKDREQAFLLDTYLDRIAFPDQLEKLQEWILKWRPVYVGVESNAFQRALAQQALRLDGFPNIVPVFAKGKKQERIMAMSPIFRTGKMRVSPRHSDFIDQWLAFDPEKKNQRDDLLDAVEIALGVAGILLPLSPHVSLIEDEVHTDHSDLATLVKQQVKDQAEKRGGFDPDIGDFWS